MSRVVRGTLLMRASKYVSQVTDKVDAAVAGRMIDDQHIT